MKGKIGILHRWLNYTEGFHSIYEEPVDVTLQLKAMTDAQQAIVAQLVAAAYSKGVSDKTGHTVVHKPTALRLV